MCFEILKIQGCVYPGRQIEAPVICESNPRMKQTLIVPLCAPWKANDRNYFCCSKLFTRNHGTQVNFIQVT